MILKSFDAFKRVVYSKFSSEDFIGVITKEKMDQIISSIRKGEYVNETFHIQNSDAENNVEKDAENWYGLRIEWNHMDRAGILAIKCKEEIDWYKFNLGSLRLNHLYELVPDLDKSDEEKMMAVTEEESLDDLMRWER